MATINDGILWACATLGDDPRGRSLLKVGQTSGLLITSGRGRGSPAMQPTDFAALACMALMHDGPTKAPAVVRDLFTLPLSRVSIDPGDGTLREMSFDAALADDGPADDDGLLRPRALLAQRLSEANLHTGVNLLHVLIALFDGFEGDGWARGNDFHPYDTLSLATVGDRRTVRLTLHGPAYRTAAEGADAHELSCQFGYLTHEAGALRTTRTLDGEALTALGRLTREVA